MNAPCRYILGFRVIVGVLGLAVGSANLAHAQGEDAACDEMLARYSILLEQAQFADALDVAQEREGECPSEDSSFMVGLALANLLEHKLLTADRQTAALDEALRRLKRAVDAPLTKEDWRQTAADWVEFLQNMQPDPPPDTAQAPAAPAAGTATLDAAAVPPALPPALPLAVGEPLDTPGGATGEVGAAASEDGPVVDSSAVAEDAAAPTAPAAPAELAPSPETAALAAPAATAREQRPAEPAAEERSTSALGPTLSGRAGCFFSAAQAWWACWATKKTRPISTKLSRYVTPTAVRRRRPASITGLRATTPLATFYSAWGLAQR